MFYLFLLYSKISIAHTPHQGNFLQDMNHYRKPQLIELSICGAQSQLMHLQYEPHEFRLRHPCGWRDWKIGRGKGSETFLLDFALEKYQDIYTHEVSSTCLPNMSFTRSQQTCKHGRKKTTETSRRTKNYRQLNNFESWRGDMVFPMGEFPDCVSNTKWSELRSYIYR